MSGKSRLTLKPTIDDLNHGDSNLKEMMRFIKHLIHRSDAQTVAHNAALAYLAMISAFQQAGLVELEWVPVLTIDVGDAEYEVC